MLALCLLEAGARPAAGQAPGRRVLLVYTEPRLTPAIVTVDTRIRAVLEAGSPGPVTFYTEYLDLVLFEGPAPQAELRELLRRKYATRPLDLIVAAGSQALRIALHNRAELFSDAPIVFAAVDPTAAADLRLDADVTGTWLRMGWTETLELARRLQPGLQRAVVVTGASPVDRVWMAGARKQLEAARGPIEVAYLGDLGLEQVLAEVKGLPRGTAVLVGVFVRDATGRDFRTPEAVSRISAAASVPVYGLTEIAVGAGAVGGQVVRFEEHGRVAAELALRVLAGERPAPTDAGTTAPVLDARQLERWGLDERRLPAGSLVLFQGPPSVWARYRWYIIAAVGALVVQGGLIAGLLVQRVQRRRARRHLAERLRFETLISDLSSRFVASSALDTGTTIQSGLRLVGEGLGLDWITIRVLEDPGGAARLSQAWTRSGVAPRPAVIREDQTPWIFGRARQGHVVRLSRPGDLPEEAATDRQSLQSLATGSTIVLPLIVGRAVLGFFSFGVAGEGRAWPDDLIPRLQLLAEVFANALERRRAGLAARESETQIRDLAGRLMTAQEAERRRIARDLHDDVNQELAALSIALSRLGERLPPSSMNGLGDELAGLQARAVELSAAVRHLSHELHPGVLEHVGLVAALRSHCRRFEREQGLPVAFLAEGELAAVPPDVGLCLYRVVQEGLGNVAKHAGARAVRVELRGGPDLELTIADDGRGFDPLEARNRRGLGLLSLDERVRLVGGRLAVDARPQRGTELRIVVPRAP